MGQFKTPEGKGSFNLANLRFDGNFDRNGLMWGGLCKARLYMEMGHLAELLDRMPRLACTKQREVQPRQIIVAMLVGLSPPPVGSMFLGRPALNGLIQWR